ncbi:hypothetical protein SELMODRAFT_106751 [Selaginella moellendorffii]|uniref:Chromosome transmission fidelity protein 8 n=1 Tax=Selaginella moellendorffii TaxID=88036 RepID=D8S2C1_SELML|nr:hypothetical protein SELMODRAFT_106751 [Selaginella moellendorffii]
MIIQVRCDCGAQCKQWAIIELQGSIELQNPEQQLQGLEIGSLCRASEVCGKFSFTVGYHELEGRKMTLKKPLLVLRSSKSQNPRVDEAPSSSDLEVVGVVRHKILFKTRPKALISSKNSLFSGTFWFLPWLFLQSQR